MAFFSNLKITNCGQKGRIVVASNVFVYTKTLFALQNACWRSAPTPFDLHFPMQATPPCGMLLRMSIVTSYEKACTFLAQGSIEEFDGSCYNSRRCVLCGLHTNKVKRSYWTWIRFICCPVRNATLIFEMLMVSRKYTTLTAPSVANFSTAPAAQRPKLSGCVKIGS